MKNIKYRRGSFTPIRFIIIDGRMRAIRAYETEQAGRLMFSQAVQP